MTDDEELIEQVARVLDAALAFEVERDVYAGETTHEERCAIARAILPIIKAERIRGGEMVKKEAARENLMICLTNCEELTDEAMEALNFAADRIRALSVPTIVEAGEHQPKENSDG